MTPDHEDSRPTSVTPPIFVPPESETRPEEALLYNIDNISRKASSADECTHWQLEAIRAHVLSETAGLRAEIDRLKKNVGCARQQGTTQFCAEAVALRALIVRLQGALTMAFDGKITGAERYAAMEQALALTPKDLEGCIVVKRSDFERRVIAAPMRCSKCGKMVESPTTGFSLNACFSCGGEMKTCRRPDTLEGALIRIEELEEDSLRIANGSEVARLREAIKWDKTQDDLEAAELSILHDEIAALKAKCDHTQCNAIIAEATQRKGTADQRAEKAEADLTACREELRVAKELQTRMLIDREVVEDARKYLVSRNAELVAALKGVVRVADRKTDEFDAARVALANNS